MESPQARRYRILEVLGAGGFGTVYRAELITGSGLMREVALKVLNERAAASEEAAARLRDEARILSALNFSGIVRVDDLMMLDGRWTMVMEFVRGDDLQKLLEVNGPLPLSVALEITASVARTLHAVAVARGPDGKPLDLVHRDIKPANILVGVDGGTRLLDFGVARAELGDREAHTQKFIVMGSLPYLAPERYGFLDTPAGDVYGLGAVLYEMLTGEQFGRTRPFMDDHHRQLREALHLAWQNLPADGREDVLALLASCLAFDHNQRPAAQALATRALELRRHVSGPGLSQWCAVHVEQVLAMPRPVGPDALCGRVLTESDSGGTLVASDDQDWPEPPGSEEEPRPEVPLVGFALPEAEPDPTIAMAAPPIVRRLAPAKRRSRAPLVFFGLAAALALAVGVSLLISGPGPEPVPPQEPPGPTEVVATEVDAAEAEDPETRSLDELGVIIDSGLAAEEGQARAVKPEGKATVRKPRPPPPDAEDEDDDEEDDEDDAGGVVAPRDIKDPWGAAGGAPKPATSPAVVRVEGNVDLVQLRGAAGSVRAGVVEPGTYTMFPSFPGGFTVRGPTFTIAAGQTLVFACDEATRTCARK